MGLFEQFPYTNFHDLNLDWILEFVKNAEGIVGGYEERMAAVEQAVRELYAKDDEFRAEFDREIARLDRNDSTLGELYRQLLEQVQAIRGVPAGGGVGQVLTADGAGGYAWADAPAGASVVAAGYAKNRAIGAKVSTVAATGEDVVAEVATGEIKNTTATALVAAGSVTPFID